MSQDDHRRLNEILVFVTNIAHAARITAYSLLEHTETIRKRGWVLNPPEHDEIISVLDPLLRNQRQTAALFVAEDLKSARYLAYEKDYFRGLELNAAEQHLQQIKTGKRKEAEVGSFCLDVLRDMKTVNSYMVEAAAYPILARHNELLPNRLRHTANDNE